MLTMAPGNKNVTPMTTTGDVSFDGDDDDDDDDGGHVRTTLTPAMRLLSSCGDSDDIICME
jgi:hypothetical protein